MSDPSNNTQHTLHPLKKIEIIVKGKRERFVQDLLERSGVSGYTIHRNVAGRGASGFHEGHLLFNDEASLVMFFAVSDQSKIQAIINGLSPLFESSSGVMFVSDTQVVRLKKFLSAEGQQGDGS
jgi:nitrogen regulatory protein PII